MTEAQLDKARGSARIIAGCLRESGVEASTDPDDVKSAVARHAQGVTLRLSWAGNGADLVVLGSAANARRTRKALSGDGDVVRDARIVIRYDNPATPEQSGAVNHCLSRNGV